MACSARRTCAGLFALACLLFACLPNAYAFPAFARKYGLPVIPVILTVLAFSLVSDGLREAADPRSTLR